MVKIEAAREANKKLVEGKPFVAVFAGGTLGIGEYTIRSLTQTHGKTGVGLRVYILGRNAAAAAKIITDCRDFCPDGDFRFLQVADLSLIKETDRCCEELVTSEKKAGGYTAHIDLLVMTQGFVDFGGRNETSEGLDASASLLYYSRIRLILNLTSLLTSNSTPSHIISVYSAGMEASGKFYPQDLSLREPRHYTFSSNRAHCTRLTTMAFEHLAKQHAGLMSLVHVFPGFVITPSSERKDLPWWFKAAWTILKVPVKAFYATSAEDIGARMLYLASERFPARGGSLEDETAGDVAKSTDDVRGGGAYAVASDGETCDVARHYGDLRKQGFEDEVWEHTMRAFAAIERGKKFSA